MSRAIPAAIVVLIVLAACSPPSRLGVQTSVNTTELGVPIYPGAQSIQSSELSSSSSQGSIQTASFRTKDSFGGVTAFYNMRLPRGSQKYRFTMGGHVSMAAFQIGSDQTQQETIITVTSKGPTTLIQITHRVNAPQRP